MEVTPEDRETLVEMKFGQLFDKFYNARREQEKNERPRKVRVAHDDDSEEESGDEETSKKRPRRRSLLEECFAQTFGF